MFYRLPGARLLCCCRRDKPRGRPALCGTRRRWSRRYQRSPGSGGYRRSRSVHRRCRGLDSSSLLPLPVLHRAQEGHWINRLQEGTVDRANVDACRFNCPQLPCRLVHHPGTSNQQPQPRQIGRPKAPALRRHQLVAVERIAVPTPLHNLTPAQQTHELEGRPRCTRAATLPIPNRPRRHPQQFGSSILRQAGAQPLVLKLARLDTSQPKALT